MTYTNSNITQLIPFHYTYYSWMILNMIGSMLDTPMISIKKNLGPGTDFVIKSPKTYEILNLYKI